MADAQQIIQDMEKYSQVKKPGIFVRAGEALKGAVSGIFTERDKTREVSDIAIKDAPDSFPAEVKTSLENIKKSPIWKKETLEKLNPDYAKHIEQLGALINTYIEKEAKIPGTKNAANEKYQEWIKAFSNFEKTTSEYSSYITLSAQVPEASVDKQKEALGITEMSADRTELISAFAYMGIEITEKDGKFEYKEIEGCGLPYKDSKGQTQYLRISTEAAKAFVENYFAEGSPTKKEEDALRLETEILENMKENQKKGGIDAPTPEDIKKQEKKVEDAQKALDAAKERTITPKGLFKYFIEQEIKGSTKKKNLDPQLITRAESMFNPDSPQWGAFSLNRDLESFNDDLALVGSLSLVTGEMQEFMETHKEVPQFDDFLTSGAADRFKVRRVVNRLENDALDMHKEIGHTVEMTDLALQNIIEKYRVKVRGLEEKARLYENKKEPVPESVEKLIEDTNKMIEALELYGDVIKNIKEGLSKLSNVPEELKTNDTLLVKTITDKVKYDEALGRVVLSEDLVNDKGEVWLSKDQFLEFYNSRVLEARGMDPNVLPDVLGDSFNVEFENGLSFAQVMQQDALQHRTKAFIQSPPNVIADWYEQFKQERKKNPKLGAAEFFDVVKKEIKEANPEASLEGTVAGFTDFDSLVNVFDLMAAKEANPNAKAEGYAESPNAAAVRDRAGLVYYHIDRVAQEIAADPELREEYESASPTDKKRIFGDVYARLKAEKKLENPTPEAINDAGARWRHYSLCLNEKGLWNDCQNCPDFNIEDKRNQDLMGVLDSLMSRDYEMLERVTETFAAQGKPVVDYEAELEQEMEDDKNNPKKKTYGELFPRPKPAFKIEKDLQPFNIKAGLKMMDMIVAAMQKIVVKNPWYVESQAAVGGEDYQAPTGDGDGQGPVEDAQKGLFETLDETQIRHAAAMSAVGAGVKDILGKMELGNDTTAPGVISAIDYMNNMAVKEPVVNFGDKKIPLPDAMRHILLNFATGNGKNADGSPMSPEQQQAANLQTAKNEIEALKGQLSQVEPGTPAAEQAQKAIATLDNFAFTFTSALLNPAEVAKLIGMTSTSTMQPNENGTIEISPGADLTPEQVATLKTCKTQEEFDKKAIEFGLYKQNIVNEVYGVKQEAQAAMENGDGGMGNA